MQRLKTLVNAKIQRLTVTDKNLRYEGSLELDGDLMQAAGLFPAEVIQVVNVNNGARFETYVTRAEAGSGVCVLNGAAARLGEAGDEVIIMSTVLVDEAAAADHRLIRINVDKNNRIVVE